MLIRKGFKFKLNPTEEQELLLKSIGGHSRFIWNKALEINLLRLKNKQPIMYYRELDFWSKLWKKSEDYGFLKECPAHILQQKLRDLDKAFKDCFDKKQPLKRLPKFKKKNRGDSFRFPDPKQVQLENNYVTLPKIGRIKFYKSRKLVGVIKNYTISNTGSEWYISIQVEQEISQDNIQRRTKGITKAIGLDLGITNFISTSTGEKIAPLNKFKELSKKLAINQRKLRNKQKFSQNWSKQVCKIKKIYKEITDSRKDFLHKLSSTICNSHAMIVVEALKVSNMSKSAKGTLEEPGRNVNAKRGLNKAILDQGWSEFKRQLKYKAEWLGSIFLEVSPRYTSQKCSNCNYVCRENRQTQSKFQCVTCNHEEHADINAAKNILAAGHAVLACGASA